MFAWLRRPAPARTNGSRSTPTTPRPARRDMPRRGPGRTTRSTASSCPAHGLGLLTLDPAVLGNDRQAVQKTLRGQVLRPRARAARGRRRARRPRRAASASHRPAPRAWRPRRSRSARSPAPAWTPVKVERTPVPRGFVQGFGVLAGLAFTALLIVEVYVGVIVVAFGDGRLVLGLAICSRGRRARWGRPRPSAPARRGWACACAIGGAPVVAWVALLRRPGRSTSSRRRWPGCWRCSPARSRSSARHR